MTKNIMQYIKHIPLDASNRAEMILHESPNNAFDIGKAMKHQGIVSKSTFYQW